MLSGIMMTGTVYGKWNLGSLSDVQPIILQQGLNSTGDIGAQVGFAVALANLDTINTGVQRASILIPHTTNTTAVSGFAGGIQTIVDKQQIINAGIQKASLLVPHTTNT
jgi:hypothetical protein